jgi:hypothetical protein
VYGERVGEIIESSSFMLTIPGLNVDLFFSTPLTRGFFSPPPTKILAHVDDDELPKNGPIRV